MSRTDDDTRPTEQQVGPTACARLLGTLVGHVLSPDKGNWFLRLRRTDPGGVHRSVELRELDGLAHALGQLQAGAGRVEAQVHLHQPGAFLTPGCDGLYAATCVCAAIHLAHLYRRGAPLHDANLETPGGSPRLRPGHIDAARNFAVRHAGEFVFRPSVALASYDTVYLFFLVPEPTALLSNDKERLDRVQHRVARLLHGGYAPRVGSWFPLPLRCADSRKLAARLLWAHPEPVYDLGTLDQFAGACLPHNAPRPTRSKPSPPEVRLRTLMDGYTLADLSDLPAPMRQIIASGHRSAPLSLQDDVPSLVDAMAHAGFGFEDVRLVLSDTRFPLALSVHIDGSLRRGLGLRFINALRWRRAAYRPRLPYGIATIASMHDESGQTSDRYAIIGGTKRQGFRMEISHDVLISARRFHRALANHLKSFPYRVPQEVWEDVVLRRGLRDPRVTIVGAEDAETESRPLVERIEAFASEAMPLEPWSWSPGDPIPWPVVRDGQVVFRLAALSHRLAQEIQGPAPGRSEVAAAVRACGGAPYGAMRFGKRVIRVWTLPYAGRVQPGGRGPA